MTTGRLRVATCQFGVGSRIECNAWSIQRFMREAKRRRADIVHFSECALSGYAGVDYTSLRDLDWEALKCETERIMELSARLGIWTILGSTHRLEKEHKPHNSLYVIDAKGRLMDRYDKRFCMERDLEHYTPGDHFTYFQINGVKCSVLICYDLRFPELYRQLKKKGVELILQSFYNARQTGRTVHTDIIRQTMQCRAASNYFWVSLANSSAYYSAYPSCFICPDGRIHGQLWQHRPGIMINVVDIHRCFYDASGPFRTRALQGKLSSRTGVRSRRSQNRTIL